MAKRLYGPRVLFNFHLYPKSEQIATSVNTILGQICLKQVIYIQNKHLVSFQKYEAGLKKRNEVVLLNS